MRRFLVIIVFFFVAGSVFAQGYKQSAGIRASWASPGLEYRYYTGEQHSFRGLLAIRNRGLQLHALSEFYQYDLFSFSYQLVFFYGAGVHAGFESWDEISEVNEQRRAETRSAFLAGVDGVVGVEYLFYEAPVKLGIEVKPYLDFFGKNGFDVYLPDFALTVRYLF
ncbi:hypothetical protein D1164_10420 [Mariniphaga sediminis]|uniref:DUF3575 domain-containing protein n=1 Tax=Mariniphaga sediminis TaxID=1628158 RepID=A0A399D076_9BACT|nr:hypothetical protein [Mariniphaga sediminis]RIH64997.1 hypothetical protein D1164_10420 [Mariniphaga sediminis]